MTPMPPIHVKARVMVYDLSVVHRLHPIAGTSRYLLCAAPDRDNACAIHICIERKTLAPFLDLG